MNRRQFIRSALLAGSSLALLSNLNTTMSAPLGLVSPAAAGEAKTLKIVKRSLDIRGRAASVYGLTDPDGRPGLTFTEGDRFSVSLLNTLNEPTLVHWHGLRPPFDQDGVPLAGAIRDTVQVPPMASVTIAFDADHPGKWAFHCHHLYHMASGMMSFVTYEDFA